MDAEAFWKQRWLRRLSKAFEIGIDIEDPDWVDYMQHRHDEYKKICEKISKKSGYSVAYVADEFEKGIFSDSDIWEFL